MLLAANRKLIYFLATRNRFSVLFTVNTVQFLVMSETSINIHIQRETTWVMMTALLGAELLMRDEAQTIGENRFI